MTDRRVRRVLQVHTRYRQAGGEDRVVEAEKRLLEAAGIAVHQVLFGNDDLTEGTSPAGDLRLAASAIWSRAAVRRVRSAITALRPEVMHVHNTFVAASPSVYSAGKEVAVVQTLHNYRMVCPVATAFRDGHACTDCVGRFFPWPSVVHACLHGSRSQSVVAAAALVAHRAIGTYKHRIDSYIAVTAFQRRLMIAGGLPPERIRVIPNFLEPDPGEGTGQRSGLLYVGRLSEEKGIRVLLEAAAALRPGTVRVIGEGPLQLEVERSAAAGAIAYLGPLEHSAVLDEVRRAIAVVVPSTWFEGFPLVVLEAFASGTPVIASDIGSLAEVVEEGLTGMLARPHEADNLEERLRWAADRPRDMREMGSKARERYETRFRGPMHLEALLETYAAVGARTERAGRNASRRPA